MTILIASSVVRGSHQGESHGGIYLIDVDRQQTALAMDWNTSKIDWQGRGWDRGLRGIAFGWLNWEGQDSDPDFFNQVRALLRLRRALPHLSKEMYLHGRTQYRW